MYEARQHRTGSDARAILSDPLLNKGMAFTDRTMTGAPCSLRRTALPKSPTSSRSPYAGWQSAILK